MKTRIRSLFLSSLKLMASQGSYTACLCMIAFVAGVSAQAATLSISYNFTGGPTGPPVVSGTNLILDGFFSGSVLSGNPALNAGWNPVTYSDHSVVDTTTGLLNGTFVMTFASGDMLSGKLFEDVSAIVASGGTVPAPFTQTFTFTAGTGNFGGATGSASGAGFGDSVSGSGTINAPAIAPEPASFALFFGGLLVIAARRKRIFGERRQQ